jgi:hypothetical protein
LFVTAVEDSAALVSVVNSRNGPTSKYWPVAILLLGDAAGSTALVALDPLAFPQPTNVGAVNLVDALGPYCPAIH